MMTTTQLASPNTGAPLLRAQPTQGHRLGPWQLHKQLAQGSIADLYLAQAVGSATQQACQYVVKVLRREWQDHPLILRQFRHEATLTRRLYCPHLLSSVDQLLDQQPLAIVFPYLPGQTVEQLLQRQQLLPPAIALGIARQVATALHVLHEAGFLHGDLKPANIMVSPAGHVTLIDLGSAQAICEVGSIWDRPVLGTPKYLAPEQFVSKLRIDERSDIYSLGVVLFEMLTGRSPYPGASSMSDLATAIKQTKATPLRQFVPHVSTTTAEFVQRLLAKQPQRRPESAAAVVSSIAHAELSEIQSWASSICGD